MATVTVEQNVTVNLDVEVSGESEKHRIVFTKTKKEVSIQPQAWESGYGDEKGYWFDLSNSYVVPLADLEKATEELSKEYVLEAK